jgi:hypothetical protein
MKKSRILSLLLVVAMMASMLTGCGSIIALKDIQSDPAKYIEDGLKKSLAESPVGDILTLTDPEAVAMNMVIKPVDEEGHIKFDATVGLKEFAMLCNLDLSVDSENMQGSIFVDENNLAVKSELLKDIFGTTAVGVGLNDFVQTLKASAWYKMLIVDSGIEEELKNENGETIDLQAIIDLYIAFLKDLEDISNNCVEYNVIEDAMEFGDKTVKGYKITQTTSKDAADKVAQAFEKFMDGLMNIVPVEDAEDFESEMDEMIDEMKKTVNDMIASTKTTYFVAKKGGAVLEIRYNTKKTEVGSLSGAERISTVDMVVNFGADPEKSFSPKFEIKMDDDGTKTSINGQAAVNTKDKTFNVDAKFEADYPEDYEWMEDEQFDISIVLDANSNYTFNVTSGEETHALSGKFKVDGTKINFTVDADKEEDLDVSIEFSVDFGAKKPVAFEYEDILKWDEAKIQSLLEKFMDESEPDYEYDWE